MTFLLLAQLPPPDSAQSIGWLALALAALIAGVNQVLKFTDRFRQHPPLHTTYATKAEHAELKARVEEIGKDIKAGFEKLDQKRSNSVGNVHELVREQAESIAALKADSATHTRHLLSLEGKIDNLLRRS